MPSFWTIFGLMFVLITPVNLILLLYFTSFALFIHKLVLRVLPEDISNSIIRLPYVALSHVYVMIGRLWHGFSIVGLENVPRKGPALLVFYHAPMPVDMYYFNATLIIDFHRRCRFVGDRFLTLVPGFGALLDALYIKPLTSTDMCNALRDNKLVCLSPGGLREALFSDSQYSLVWNNRQGFAKVWLDTASVPIIPIFTINGREAFRPAFGKFLRSLYERIRLPIVPIFGGMPVKLTTVVGKPIKIPEMVFELKKENPDAAAKMVAEATASALRALIKENQRLPGDMLSAVRERFVM